MADQILINPKLYVNQFDLSGDVMAVALNYGCELVDNTKSRDSASAADPATRINSPSHATASAEVEGVVNLGLDLSDEEFDALHGVADTILTICPGRGDGLATIDGEIGFNMKALVSSLSRSGPVGEKFKFTCGFEISSDSIKRGTIMHDASSARVASGNGVARQLGAVSATQKVWAALHVFERSAADTLDVIVQSDTVGFPSPTNRITFAQVTDANANNRQYLETAVGAIADDYWRVNYTIAGVGPSFRFVVLMGIR